MTRKDLNNCLLEAGFHHVWGVWIHNDNHNIRIRVECHKKKLTMWPGKIPNSFKCEDKIQVVNKINGELVSNFTVPELVCVIKYLKEKFA